MTSHYGMNELIFNVFYKDPIDRMILIYNCPLMSANDQTKQNTRRGVCLSRWLSFSSLNFPLNNQNSYYNQDKA